MSAADVISLISNVGFPVVLTVVLMGYIKTREEKHDQQLKEERQQHDQESKNMTEAINNNTLVLQRLIDKLGKE
jgi:hypothetical protein